MSKPLIVVESPTKARTISKFLGRRYEVKSTMGHIRDLPKSRFGVDMEKGFEPQYITIRGKGEIVKDLKDSARKASKIFLATDPDREGEAISWHLASLLALDGSAPNRVEFHEITKDVIQRALKSPRNIDMNLVNAQQTRRILDRIVGYRLSPLLWRKVRPGLSAGRVQSVALRLICDREQEIESFVKEEYWTITARLSRLDDDNVFEAKYYGKGEEKENLRNEAQTREIIADVQDKDFRVTSVKKKEKRRSAPPPFTTSTLQQEASRKLGFAAKRTMRVAQQLYEGVDMGPEGPVGLITYIRTDSIRVSESASKEAVDYIKNAYGPEFAIPEERKEKKKFVQGAHEAIRPTMVRRQPDVVKGFLTSDQHRLYKLIWERFIASQMSAALYDTVSAEIEAGAHVFRATGSTIRFKGFMAVYIEGMDEPETEDGKAIPEIREGETLKLVDLVPKQHFTQPPPRYTEAMLVKVLEEKGIGRPSTYAPIISTIMERGYVDRKEKRFFPTDLGKLVIEILRKYFPNIIDVEFTAELEGQLDRVESGELEWKRVLEDFYKPFQNKLDVAEQEMGGFELPDEETDVVCELCGRKMVIKRGRYGKFLACPGFPECKNTKPYLEEVGVNCPECGGKIVARKSRKGRMFYGCSEYPRCNFVTWDKPTTRTCPKCGAFVVEKRSKGNLKYHCVRCDYVG